MSGKRSKLREAGFDYFDQITKDLCSADHQEFENLLKVTNTDPRAAKKRSWELVAKTMCRCAGKEPSHLDPNSPELEEVIGYLRKSAHLTLTLKRTVAKYEEGDAGNNSKATFSGSREFQPSDEDVISLPGDLVSGGVILGDGF
jgi:hypothetical protein